MSRIAVEQLRKQLVAGNAWFGSLHQGLQRALLAEAEIRRLATGEWLYGTGDPPAGVYAVLSGLALIYVPLERGDDVLVHVAAPGEIFGHAAQLGHGPRLATVMAAHDSSFVYLSEAGLMRAAAQEPGLWQALTRLLYRQLGATLRVHAETLALPLQARLGRRLLQLAGRGHGGLISLPQSVLAESLGASRKSVNAGLQELERMGAIRLGYRQVQVLDPGLLAAVAADRHQP